MLIDMIEESVLIIYLSKPKQSDIVDSLKDLYHDYWVKKKRDLVMVPAMNATKLILKTFSYTQNLAAMAAAAQKTNNKNAWSLIQNQAYIKACKDEATGLKEHPAKKKSYSKEIMTLKLEQEQQEANLLKNQ